MDENFYDEEKKLFKDHRLNTQIRLLDNLKTAVSKIWQGDRNVKSYTDHGSPHCENIFVYLGRLLPLAHKKLEPNEAFVLFAAVYLHDIGMQCNDMEIFQLLGLDIKNNTQGKYNDKEQKIIRENHHKISAKWIEKAIEGKCPDLSPIIKEFCPTLPGAIVKVVFYHAKEDYQKCERKYEIDPDIRLKLLVMLLRLADELDIGADRIDIEEVRRQNLDLEENGYIWWLHYLTKPYIDVTKGNGIIKLITYAHSEDLESVKEPLRYLIVQTFEGKNKTLVDALFKEGFFLAYSPQNPVSAEVRKIPVEVKDALWKKYRELMPSKPFKEVGPKDVTEMGNFVERRTEVGFFKKELKGLQNIKCIYIWGRPGMGKSMLLHFYRIIANKTPGYQVKLIRFLRNYSGALSPKLAEEFSINHEGRTSGEVIWEFVEKFRNNTIILIDEFPAKNGSFNKEFEQLYIRLREKGKKGIFITTSREKPIFINNLACDMIMNTKSIKLTGFKEDKILEIINKLESRCDDKYAEEFKDLRENLNLIADKTEGNPDIITKMCKNPLIWRRIKDEEVSAFEFQKEVLCQVWKGLSKSLKEAVKIFVCIGVISGEWLDNTAEEITGSEWIKIRGELLDHSVLIQSYDIPKSCYTYKIHDLLRDFIYDQKITTSEKKELHRQIAKQYINRDELVTALDHYIMAHDDSVKTIYERAIENLGRISDINGIEKRIKEIRLHLKHDRRFNSILLVDLCEMYLLQGRINELLEMRKNVSLRCLDPKYRAKMLWVTAEALRVSSKYNESIVAFKRSKKIYNKLRDEEGEVNSLNHMAKCYYLLTECKKSINIYKDNVLPICERIRFLRGKADALYGIAKDLRLLGTYTKAIKYFEEALSIYKKINNQIGIGNATFDIGLAWQMLGDYTEALKRYEEAITIFNNIGFRAVAWVPYGFAEIERSKKSYDKALELYEDALNRSREIGDINRIAHAYLGKAETFRMKGEYRPELYQLALKNYQRIKSNWGIINTIVGMSLAKIKYKEEVVWKELHETKHLAKTLSLKAEEKLIQDILDNPNSLELHPLNFP